MLEHAINELPQVGHAPVSNATNHDYSYKLPPGLTKSSHDAHWDTLVMHSSSEDDDSWLKAYPPTNSPNC
jgi:hypothetical protein